MPLAAPSRRLRRSSIRNNSTSTSTRNSRNEADDKENTVNTTTTRSTRTLTSGTKSNLNTKKKTNTAEEEEEKQAPTMSPPDTPIRPTPYHVVISETGRAMSPRLTRSSKKGKRRDDADVNDDNDNPTATTHGSEEVPSAELLVFSPPTEKHARDYEENLAQQQKKAEKERQSRIRNLRRKNLLDISPPSNKCKKQRTIDVDSLSENQKKKKDKMFYLEFSPGGSYMGDPSKLELCLSHNELQAAFVQLTAKYDESLARVKTADHQLLIKNEEIRALKDDQHALQNKKEEEIMKMRDVIKSLESSISLKGSVDEENHRRQLAMLTKELKDSKEDNRQQGQTFDLTIKTLNANLNSAKEEIDSLKLIASEKVQVEKTLAKVEAQAEFLKGELEKSREIAISRGNITDAKYEEILSAIHSNASKQSGDKELKEAMWDLKSKCEQLMEERKEITQKLNMSESRSYKLNDELIKRQEELQVTLSMYEDALKQIESAKAKLVDLENSSKVKETEMENEITRMQSELSKMEESYKENMKLKVKYETLQAELDLIQKESSSMKRNNDILDTEIATLQAEISALKSQLLSAENAMKSEERLKRSNESQLSEMKKSEETLHQELEYMHKTLASTQSQLEVASSNLTNEKQLRIKLEESMRDIKNQMESLDDKLKQNQKLSKQAQNEILRAKSERDDAIERLSTFDERETEYIRQISILDEVRKSLHNRVMQLSGNIRVFVRVRPALPEEINILVPRANKDDLSKTTNRRSINQHKRSMSNIKESQPSSSTPFHFPHVTSRSIEADSNSALSCNNLTKNLIELVEPSSDKGRGGLKERLKRHRFGFDGIFSPNDDQQTVWNAVEPLVQSSIDGYNATLFAYGQTGSGKTFTMLGGDYAGSEGIIRRSVRKVFAAKESFESGSSKKQRLQRLVIGVEMIEVYNEQIRDLLSDHQSSDKGDFSQVIMNVDNENLVMSLLEKAQQRRCVRSTNSNSESSRSHLLFTLHISMLSDDAIVYKSKLNICDLAGSERLSKSGSAGVSLRETQNINSSLSVLSNVIEKLQAGSSHVPFRDSKLTYLLSNSLAGDSKTLAIICCNPLAEHYHESLCSLRFASKVGKVELKAKSSVNY